MRYFAFDLRFVPFFIFLFRNVFTRLIYTSLPTTRNFVGCERWDYCYRWGAVFFFSVFPLTTLNLQNERALAIYHYMTKELFLFLPVTISSLTLQARLHVSRVLRNLLIFFLLKRFLQVRRPVDWEYEVAVGMSVYIHERSINRTFRLSTALSIAYACVILCARVCVHVNMCDTSSERCSLSDFRKGRPLRGRSES